MTTPLRGLLLELCARQDCGMLHLDPLDAGRVERVIAARFDEPIARAIGRAVLEVSGGHPAIVAAVLQHLARGAGMNLSVSHWRDAEPATTAVAVQDGARDAVLWRLANMDRGDRAVLEAAAVAGLSFTSADVMMALAANVPGVPACLDRLAARGLIRRDDAAAGAASPSYCFWHPLHAELVAGGAPGFDILRASSNLSARRTRRVEIA